MNIERTLEIYPNGNKSAGASGKISLYVRLDTSSLIKDPKDVYAEIKFFVYNRIKDKYYSRHGTNDLYNTFRLISKYFGSSLNKIFFINETNYCCRTSGEEVSFV